MLGHVYSLGPKGRWGPDTCSFFIRSSYHMIWQCLKNTTAPIQSPCPGMTASLLSVLHTGFKRTNFTIKFEKKSFLLGMPWPTDRTGGTFCMWAFCWCIMKVNRISKVILFCGQGSQKCYLWEDCEGGCLLFPTKDQGQPLRTNREKESQVPQVHSAWE